MIRRPNVADVAARGRQRSRTYAKAAKAPAGYKTNNLFADGTCRPVTPVGVQKPWTSGEFGNHGGLGAGPAAPVRRRRHAGPSLADHRFRTGDVVLDRASGSCVDWHAPSGEDETAFRQPEGAAWPMKSTLLCSSGEWRSGTSGGRRTLTSCRTSPRPILLGWS